MTKKAKELILATFEPDPTAGGSIHFLSAGDYVYYIQDKEILDNVYEFFISQKSRPLLRKALDVMFVLPPESMLFLILQQFTAFKPLAHRPKPMLAKP